MLLRNAKGKFIVNIENMEHLETVNAAMLEACENLLKLYHLSIDRNGQDRPGQYIEAAEEAVALAKGEQQ